MSVKTGEKALNGEGEKISAYAFQLTEDMIMEFEGRSCNILDGEGRLVEKLGTENGRVKREILSGYRCYVMQAWVQFQKKSTAS